MTRMQELCRKLRPVLGKKIDRLWTVYLAESDAYGKADIEQTLELLAAKHLGQGFMPDRSPFPPPEKKFAGSGDIRLSSNSDRNMFSEALTLYLYRYRLAQGPQDKLTNLIVLEEAHNLLLKKGVDTKESILENSIRMIRQYGMGYVFVDQSASLLSKVAFANSYATLALSQKLKSDIMTIAGAMNLTDEQKESLSTLPIGSAVVRLADEHPEPFLVRIPRFPIREGSVSDETIRSRMAGYFTKSNSNTAHRDHSGAVSPVPSPDKKDKDKNLRDNIDKKSHPPSPEESQMTLIDVSADSKHNPPSKASKMSREEIRFLADVTARPLSTTVSRYQRLSLSRRRGNAIRQNLQDATIIEPVPIATRSGQVVLYQLTDFGRSVCSSASIDPAPRPRESLEHRYWIGKAAEHFEKKGYEITREHPIKGNGAIDILAEKPGNRIAIEIETGKSDIKANLAKVKDAGFDRIILLATSPTAVSACQKAIDAAANTGPAPVELMTWLDIS